MDFVETTGSLDPTQDTIVSLNSNVETFYYIDFSKLSNVNDLVLVLASMGFGISDKNPGFDLVKQWLNLDKPVKLK